MNKQIMKHLVCVVIAVLSLIVAVPLSRPTIKPVHVVAKPIAKIVHQTHVEAATATITPAPLPLPQIQLPDVQCAQYASLFEQYSWNVPTAIAICQAESGGDPNSISNANINYDGIPDYGLMQIHGEYILDPAANVARAYKKYLDQGWGAWSTYNSGKYANYL